VCRFLSRCQDVRMLTTGYRAMALQIGPGLFSPMDFCFSQTSASLPSYF